MILIAFDGRLVSFSIMFTYGGVEKCIRSTLHIVQLNQPSLRRFTWRSACFSLFFSKCPAHCLLKPTVCNAIRRLRRLTWPSKELVTVAQHYAQCVSLQWEIIYCLFSTPNPRKKRKEKTILSFSCFLRMYVCMYGVCALITSHLTPTSRHAGSRKQEAGSKEEQAVRDVTVSIGYFDSIEYIASTSLARNGNRKC